MLNEDGINGVKRTDLIEKNDVDILNGKKQIEAKIPTPNGLGIRHLQIFLLFLGLLSAYSLRVNLSVGIVAMVDKTPNSSHAVYDWDETKQGFILSSFFWGYLISQVPVSHIAQKYGAKIMLLISSIFCALLTIITPWAAAIDYKALVLIRALQGLFQGFIYPCVHMLLSKWAHPTERGILTTFTYSGTQAGTVIMLGVSGILASSTMGWPSIFYFSGTATLVWSILWYIYGCNSPADSTNISADEKSFIESMPGSSNQRQLSVPWKEILISKPVIALIVVHAAQCWGFWTLLTETPTFLKQIFHFNIKTNALLSALPYLVMWFLSLCMSPISDYVINRGYISVRFGRKLFNSIGHWIPMIALILLPFATNAPVAVLLLTLAVGINAATYVGYMVNHMDLAPNFAGSLMGLTNSIANIMSILGPLTVGYILTDSTDSQVKNEEWKLVFFIAAGFYFSGNLIFVLFGKAEIQPWNEPKIKSKIDSVKQIGASTVTVETLDS